MLSSFQGIGVVCHLTAQRRKLKASHYLTIFSLFFSFRFDANQIDSKMPKSIGLCNFANNNIIGFVYSQQTCGNNYFGVCDEFRNAPNRRQLILEGIRKATFQDATNQKFDFSDNGESNRGYHIYTARKAIDSPNYYYENVSR